MVAISGFGDASAPAVRRPTADLAVGAASASAWRGHVAGVAVTATLAPDVGVATVVTGGPTAPDAALGDPATITLGYADGGGATVMTGHVVAVTEALDGARRLTIHDAAAVLARLRVALSYHEQRSGEIVRDLAGRAGVSVGRADPGVRYPSVVVDGGRTAWRHLAALARRSGHLARVDADGHLVVAPADAVATRLDASSEVVAADVTRWHTTTGAVRVVGEGAAGTHGADAWAWLARDVDGVSAVAGGGDRIDVRDPALRSVDAVRAAAEAELATRQRLAATCRLRLAGVATVRPGGTVEVTGGAAATVGAGPWLVTAVRHRLGGAFTTELTLVGVAATGRGGPSPAGP